MSLRDLDASAPQARRAVRWRRLALRILGPALVLVATSGCSSWEEAKTEALSTQNLANTAEFSSGVIAGFCQQGVDLAVQAKKGFEFAEEAVKNASVEKAAAAAKAAAERLDGWWKQGKEAFKKIQDDPDKALKEVSDAVEQAQQILQKVGAKIPELTKQFQSLAGKIPDIAGDENKQLLFMQGDWESLGIDVSPEFKEAILDALGFIEWAWDDIKKLTPYKKGMVVGGVLFAVFPWGEAAKGVLGVASRITGITREAKMLEACGLPVEVITRWEGRVKIIETQEWCFRPDTPVLTVDGPRAISALVPGDLVLSRDSVTWRQSYHRVTRVFTASPEHALEIRYHVVAGIATGAAPPTASGSIVATANHPVYSPERQEFIRADELILGGHLVTADGDTAVIDAVDRDVATGPADFVNLAVEGTATYFVGDAGLWVHNAGTGPCKLAWEAIERLKKLGIPAKAMKNGKVLKLTDVAAQEYYATMYNFHVLCPNAEAPRFEYNFMKSVLNTYQKRNFGGGLWKPPRLIKYAESGAVLDVPNGFQFRYMTNVAKYAEGLTLEVPPSLHTMRGTGMERVLDDYLIRAMKADGFTWTGGGAGADPANYAKVVSEAPAFFKTLKKERQLALMKAAYAERYGMDLEGLIGVDGLKP